MKVRKYEEIKDFLQTCGSMRAELRSASKQLNAAVYQLESDNKLLLRALELFHEDIYYYNWNAHSFYDAASIDYWIEKANESNS